MLDHKFIDQLPIALVIISVFLNCMLFVMICGAYYSTKPAWQAFKNEKDIELSDVEADEVLTDVESDCDGQCPGVPHDQPMTEESLTSENEDVEYSGIFLL